MFLLQGNCNRCEMSYYIRILWRIFFLSLCLWIAFLFLFFNQVLNYEVVRDEIELGHFLFTSASLNSVEMHRDTAKGCEALECVRFIPLPPRKSLNSFFSLFSSFIWRNFTGTAILPIFVFHFSSDATYRSIPTNHQWSYGAVSWSHSLRMHLSD